MSDYNHVTIMGRICVKPELKFLAAGTAVCTLRVAASETWKDKASGEKKEETCFVDVEVWNKQAENCAEYLVKGQRVLVDGKLKMRHWEKDGVKRTKHEIRANTICFLDKPKGEAADDAPQDSAPATDEDVPF